jgi:hypothetical protein
VPDLGASHGCSEDLVYGRGCAACSHFVAVPSPETPGGDPTAQQYRERKMMRRVALALTAATALLSAGLITSTPAGGAPPPFEHLDPGGLPQLQERLPVNVVFVGYRRAD